MSSQPEASDLHVSDELVIKIKDMHKWYGSFHVLRDVNLDVIGVRESLSAVLPVPVNRP